MRVIARRWLGALDLLRGVAILAVFTQHVMDRGEPLVRARLEGAPLGAWWLTIVHHAHWGVDLFFVVSGFALAQAWLGAPSRDAWPAARGFFARRARRILPAYYVALVVVLATRRELFAAPHLPLALAAHAAVLEGFVAPGGIVLIGAAWSLTTEACFYVLLPLLAPLLFGRRWTWLVTLVVVSWAARAIAHEALLVPGAQTSLFEASQRRWITSRLDEFLIGVGAAALEHATRGTPLRAKLERAAPLALVIAVSALVAGFRLEGELYLRPLGFWPAYLITLATGALVLFVTLAPGAEHRALAPLRRVGTVSYGVFLYHQLALRLVADRLGPIASLGDLAAYAGVGLALALVLGELSWRVIESRFIARRA